MLSFTCLLALCSHPAARDRPDWPQLPPRPVQHAQNHSWHVWPSVSECSCAAVRACQGVYGHRGYALLCDLLESLSHSCVDNDVFAKEIGPSVEHIIVPRVVFDVAPLAETLSGHVFLEAA